MPTPAVNSSQRMLAALRSVSRKTAFGYGHFAERLQKVKPEKTRIPSSFGPARFRIPDVLTDRELIEIKNVARQSMTRQLRDYLHYCQATNRCMILYIRPDTHLSRTLREAIAGGSVEIRSLNKLFAQATQQRLREALKPTIMAAMMKALKKPTSAA